MTLKTGQKKKADYRYSLKNYSKNGFEGAKLRAFYVIMIPFLILFLAVKLYPFLWGFYISMTNFTGFNLGNLKFVGLSNFKRVFSDSEALPSIVRVVKIGLVTVPVQLVLTLSLSMLLCKPRKGVGVFRTLMYLPSVLPMLAVTIMWRQMYAYNGGMINTILELLGIGRVNWFGYEHARTALIIMMLYGCTGGILAKIAAINNVPAELYEAAYLEGCGPIRKMVKITLPMISNIIYMDVLLSIIGTLQLFAQPVFLAGSSTGNTADSLTATPIEPLYTYLVHIYQQIFVNMRFGYGLALVWVIFIIIMLITLIMESTKKFWVFKED